MSFRGGGGGRFSGGGGRGGGRGGGFRGGGGGRGFDQGPPERVIPLGYYEKSVQDDLVCKVEIEDVPYFNAPIYLENKQQIGKIDEIFGNIRDYWVSIKLGDDMRAGSFQANQKTPPSSFLCTGSFRNRPVLRSAAAAEEEEAAGEAVEVAGAVEEDVEAAAAGGEEAEGSETEEEEAEAASEVVVEAVEEDTEVAVVEEDTEVAVVEVLIGIAGVSIEEEAVVLIGILEEVVISGKCGKIEGLFIASTKHVI
ncbi:unnamed protein product [Phyllotreta striolata]|uniref:H/ACA ribonucleoprotein complex subunit n=1 Tax=Phyllotreta striolata TaxID=444603 RepID=A0A9N9XTT5_PHYSR|nr:unnamed protein product [Phyllotreta striolata]